LYLALSVKSVKPPNAAGIDITLPEMNECRVFIHGSLRRFTNFVEAPI